MPIGGRSVRTAVAIRSRRLGVALRPNPRLPPFDATDARARLTRLLTDNVIPFWADRSVDEAGGYHESFDQSGVPVQSDFKHALTQSRTLWFFSRLLTTGYATAGMEPAARHGFEFLRARLWDQANGGVFANSAASRGLTPVKDFYDQVMALDALAEYHVVTGSQEAARLASDLIGVIEDRFHDDGNGYLEGLNADWTPAEAGTLLLVDNPAHKTTSAHVNALSVLGRAHSLGLADLSNQVAELIELIDVRAVLPGSHLMGEKFTRDWSQVVGNPAVSYGHDLERIWMAGDARRAIGAGAFSYVPVFDEAARWGWDRRRGGFYFDGPPGAPARDLRKQWWVQAEALVASAVLRSESPTGRYGGFFEATLRWVENRQVDWHAGEWHDTIDVRGRTVGVKAWHWKTGYHTARSLLRAIEVLSPDE